MFVNILFVGKRDAEYRNKKYSFSVYHLAFHLFQVVYFFLKISKIKRIDYFFFYFGQERENLI